MEENVVKMALKILKTCEISTGVLSIASVISPDAVPFVDEALLITVYTQIHNAKKLLTEKEIDEILKMNNLSSFIVNQSIKISSKIIDEKMVLKKKINK